MQSLNRQEIKTLKRFLKLFEEGSSSDGLKTLKLANILLKDKEAKKTESDLIRALYKKVNLKNQKTFNKLIARFKDKVIECISLDVNTQRRVQYSNAEIAISSIKKSLLHFHLLSERMPEQELHRLIDKCIHSCRHYEYYSGLSQALIYKLQLLSKIESSAEAERIFSEFEFCSRCLNSLTKARQLRFELGQLPYKSSTSSEDQYLKAIEETEHEYRFTRSQQIYYLHQCIKVLHLQFKRNYFKAHLLALKLTDHCKEHKEMMPVAFRSESQLMLAESYIHLGKMKEALNILVRLDVHNDHLMRLKQLELFFLASVYLGNQKDAESNLIALKSLASYAQHYIPFVSFDYLQAIMLMMKEQFHDAFIALQSPSENLSNDPEQEIIVRLMMIINLISLNKLDLASSQLENLNNYIDRQGLAQNISIRYYRLVRIFDELSNIGFDFGSFALTHKVEIDQLIYEGEQIIWPLHKSEIVHFGLWLKSKIQRDNYDILLSDLLKKQEEIVVQNQGLSL